MTGKVYQLRIEIRAALLKETMLRIVFQLIDFSWNDSVFEMNSNFKHTESSKMDNLHIRQTSVISKGI